MNLIETDLSRAECSARGVTKGFFPDDPKVRLDDVEQALDACHHCPMAAQCLRLGLANSESGIWGGIFLAEGVVAELPLRFQGTDAENFAA